MKQSNSGSGVKAAKDFKAVTGLTAIFYEGKERSLLEVQANKAGYHSARMYAEVKGWYITVGQDEEEDWHAYSKGWHRSHGPKRTITRRYVIFTRPNSVKEVTVTSFAGNYLLKAIAEFFKIKEVKNASKSLRKVQLTPTFRIKKVRQIAGVKIYMRTLAGAHVDYCAVLRGETYHAETVGKAVSGLKKKLRVKENPDLREVDYKAARKLGFCPAGIREFCELNGLREDATYTIAEIRAAAVENRASNCRWYASELKKLGISLNCK